MGKKSHNHGWNSRQLIERQLIERTIDRIRKSTKATIDRKPTAMFCLFDCWGYVSGRFWTTRPDGLQPLLVVAWALHGS